MEEIKLILLSLNKTFPWSIEHNIDFEKINWFILFNIAKKNNLLYYVAHFVNTNYLSLLDDKTISQVQKIITNGEKSISLIAMAVESLNKDLSCDYVMHKTYRIHDRIPNDLDFIVPNYDEAVLEMTKIYGNPHHIDPVVPDANFYDVNGVKLHLHKRVGWLGRKYLDDDLYFQENRTVLFNGADMSIPNYNVDFLIHLAHMNFEPLHFTLSELAYLHSIWEYVDHDFCRTQAKKHRWLRSFDRTERILTDYNNYFFCKENVFVGGDINYVLPKTFSRLHMILTFIEKGIILEPLMKLPKVLKVLFSGDSYKGFYQAPEEHIGKNI